MKEDQCAGNAKNWATMLKIVELRSVRTAIEVIILLTNVISKTNIIRDAQFAKGQTMWKRTVFSRKRVARKKAKESKKSLRRE